jgi:hypothetical protein
MFRRFLYAIWLTLASFSASATPLFPDQPGEGHWANDALASLAARGLLEGYPDGTFKGDRAASRWETALQVARLLKLVEQSQAGLATRAELDSLRPLVNALRDELEALGVRLDRLESGLGRLDRRVTELERISFYGSLETRVAMQSFGNDGAPDNDAGRGGTGAPGTVPYLNYNSLIGSRTPAPFRPQLQGLIPTVDYRNGRALTNGTSFTAMGLLGLNIAVNEQLEAGLELVGFSSQGDSLVDSYWGISAPYLSNVFTGNAATAQDLSNAPFTRMTLDRFWVRHKPSGTRLTVGSIDKTEMDPFVYAGQSNIGVWGPRRWPGYGFQLQGRWDTGAGSHLSYEILGSRFGHNIRFETSSYQNYILSGNLAYRYLEDRGKVQLNYSRVAEEAPSGGGPLGTGWTGGLNVAYGASPGWSIRQWVNPPGYYVAQLSATQRAGIGTIGNAVDPRPITGWNADLDNAVGFGPGAGNLGPQAQDSYGISARHRLDLGPRERLTLRAEYGRSQYRPNRNGPYTAQGDMLRAQLEAVLLDEKLDLGLEYLSIDPTYSPASWPNGVVGLRLVDSFNFTGVFHLHDHARYPQNRQGVRANGRYRFAQGAGQLYARGAWLEQTRSSLYDVRLTPGALGQDAPNFPVLGFSPGFVDPLFYGFAHPNLYGAASGNSFTAELQPLENPRGSQRELDVGISYRFAAPRLRLTAGYRMLDYRRDSVLSAQLGGSQNRVEIETDSLAFDLAWEANDSLSVNAGVDLIRAAGHYDPAGLYNGYALRTGSTDFTNLDSRQVIPHLGLGWQLTETSEVEFSARYYITRDHVLPALGTGDADLGQIGSTAHPFSWSGLQLLSHFKLKF